MAEKSCSRPATLERRADEAYDFVKQFHDQAYMYTDQALTLEESAGNGHQALNLYEKSLQQLEQGLSIESHGPEFIGEKWDQVRLTQMKMRKTKEHVMSRLEELTREQNNSTVPRLPSPPTMPPSYDEACASENSASINSSQQDSADVKTYGDLRRDMLDSPMDVDDLPEYSEVPTDAKEVFSIPDGVQIFFVASDGTVSAPSYPTALSIYKFIGDVPRSAGQPPAFLQVGEWIYPLHPGQLPVLHASYGAYLFPDTNAATDSGANRIRTRAAVGLLLSDDVPPAVREMFEHIMCELTSLRSESKEAEMEQRRRLSTKLSEGIVAGAEIVSKGVVIGAEKTSRLVQMGAAKLRQKVIPNAQPTVVDPKVQKGLQVARDVTGVAVQVSGFIVTQLGRGTRALGRYLAPHVRKQGSKILSKAIGDDNKTTDGGKSKADTTIDGVLEVAAGGLQGFATVYMGLETAAKMLAESLVSETVTTVQHRYGCQAGDSTGAALYTVGNLAATAYNVNHMGIRAVAKQAAKDTGKALVENYEQSTTKKD